jgi:hypothetical protein
MAAAEESGEYQARATPQYMILSSLLVLLTAKQCRFASFRTHSVTFNKSLQDEAA